MRQCRQFYIDGAWVEPLSEAVMDVIDPVTETRSGRVALGDARDVDRAVKAARTAFDPWSRTSRQDRLALLERVIDAYRAREDDLAHAVSLEMGAPEGFARGAQVPTGLAHLMIAARVLAAYAFEEERGGVVIAREPIGVCGLITPWNWPLFLMACKVGPALAAGCTMVLKPSERAPYSAHIFAEVMDAAGPPPGVFNLVHGTGPEAGAALARHADVDMVSFTGSTRAGTDVARDASATVKRVCQELGGKSPLIVLDDEHLADGVRSGVLSVLSNAGQSCNAPTRLLVPRRRLNDAIDAAREAVSVGGAGGAMPVGPVAFEAQWRRVQEYIESGVRDGARLVAGGPGRPPGVDRGYFVRPTVFADVTNDMRIAREEIFGPVVVILTYDSLDDAVRLANDSEYGLAAYVRGADVSTARALARRLRAGQVCINGAFDLTAPFGGFRRSGNGREWGEFAFSEFLEVKSIVG